MDADYHVHSSYSDGRHLPWMVQAAADVGLEGIGFADHANVSERSASKRAKRRYAFTLDLTYDRRRAAIEELAAQWDLEIYDAVEMDYHQDDEAAIEAFLDAAEFDYAVGSVHEIDGVNVHISDPFEDHSIAERRALVEEYFDRLEALIRSELFEIAAHPDIIERNEVFRGIPGTEQYRRIADAFADSRTIAEINAGRIDADYGRFHPKAEFLELLADHAVEITVGTDSHQPEDIRERVPPIRALLQDRGLGPTSPFDV